MTLKEVDQPPPIPGLSRGPRRPLAGHQSRVPRRSDTRPSGSSAHEVARQCAIRASTMAKSRYVLAIDQGTTGTHISIVDEKVKVVARSYQEFKQHFPKPGWVEHDLNEIWRTVEACIAKAL